MGILERAQASWDSRPQYEIEVAEWGEGNKPLIVYFRSPSLATLSKVIKESKGDLIEQAARLVLLCSLNDKGERIFRPADITTMMHHVDPAVVSRIAGRIMATANVDVEEAEKNSEAIQQE